MITMMQSIRMVIVCILVFALLTISQENASTTLDGRDINLTHLIHHFLLLCGYDYICDVSKFPLFDTPTPSESYSITRVCPNCFCDTKCMSRGDCCPDVYFDMPPMACVNTTLLSTTEYVLHLEPKPPSYETVNSCPSKTRSRERNLCEKSYTPKELLTRPPVASTTFPVSYKNKHCAMCNGENDTVNWLLDIDCLKFADFNFLSTYQDIIDLAQNRKCRMRYSPMEFPVRPCNLTIQSEERFLTRSCNVSGSWKFFDLSIKLACESTYYLKFHVYKNVFCYMCNPPKRMISDVIDKCNVTGMWYPYDAGLERACMYHLTSQNTHPFKNIFCYLCNRIANDNETFYDVDTKISNDILYNGTHPIKSYIIHTNELRQEFLRYTYTELGHMIVQGIDARGINIHMSAAYKPDTSRGDADDNTVIIKKRDVLVNVSNLVHKQFAVRPFDQFCDKTIVPLQYVLVFFPTCTCSPTCLFHSGRGLCCLDFALTYPVSCIDKYVAGAPFEETPTVQLLVTDGCWRNRGHPIVRHRCESIYPTDLISFLPLIEKNENTHYRSFDCYLCNKDVDEIYPTNTIETIATDVNYYLSDLLITCDSVLDFSHHVSLINVINLSKYINCSVRLDLKTPTHKATSCITNPNIIDQCNVTGNWPVHDPDVVWACEVATFNSLPVYDNFKNFYCYLCNPENIVTDVISSCNETGQWQRYNINYEKACHLFPRIYSYPFYKNIFCEVCNSVDFPNITESVLSSTSDLGGKVDTPGPPPFIPTFRSIFSVTEYDETLPEMDGERCRKDQLYDYRKDRCRNISCFPGKILNDSSCVPLLSVTNNLRYTISIEFKGQLQGNQTNALGFLQSMEEGIKIHISKLFGTTDFKFDNFHLLSNFPCESETSNIKTETIKLYLYMTVHIEGYVPRFLTENSLLENTLDLWNISIEGDSVIGLAAETSLVAMATPSIIDKASFKETCFIQRFSNHKFVPWQTFRSVYMSKVLLCRQIELESDEYEVNALKMELIVRSIGKTLSFDKFQRSSQGRVRVCVEDVETISDPALKYVNPSLSVLTLVCNMASLACLFLTFVVYLIIPTLQSIPGINNMCLVFALFFTQLSFQFGLMVPVHSIYCEIIGIVSHVLWLSMFGCMNICSFHMFRAFSGIGKYHAVYNKVKTLKSYVTYSFGLPVIIVGLNMTFTLSLSKGQTTGYGVDKCFMSSKISFFLTFLFPIVFVCLSNIIFFSITAYKIRTTPRIDSNQDNRRHFGICVKLFFITGVTWLATVIEAFFPLSVVSYFTTVLNGCQGVFIFLSFIVNRRVYILLKEKYANTERLFSRAKSAQISRTSTFNLNSSSRDND